MPFVRELEGLDREGPVGELSCRELGVVRMWKIHELVGICLILFDCGPSRLFNHSRFFQFLTQLVQCSSWNGYGFVIRNERPVSPKVRDL